MLSAYIVSLLAGGIVLGASLFGGADGDGDSSTDNGGDSDGEHGHSHAGWAGHMPFLSLRFWTWGVTFFGLTGLILKLSHIATGWDWVVASMVGASTGWGASYLLQRLGREEVGVLPEAESHIGREGRLMLPLLAGQRSKVRLSIGEVDIELVAICDENQTIPVGTRVIVVGLRGMEAVVQPSSNVLEGSKSDDATTEKEET